MPQSYTPEFKKKIVRLHEEEGRIYKSITVEYGVSKASIQKVEEFVYVDYNHVRPHSFNGYRTPYEARMAA